ncbi:MAG: hypothetical protein CMF23_00040 [Ignavibacteriae bacterium]|nr:hypothetical protein [Ignavibacteriota bacterium]
MTLHEEIKNILLENGKPLTTSQIADFVNDRKIYLKRDNSKVSSFQIHGRTKNYSNIFLRNKTIVGLRNRDEALMNSDEFNSEEPNYQANNPIINFMFNQGHTEFNDLINVDKIKFLIDNGFINLGKIKHLLIEGLPQISELQSSGLYAITAYENYKPSYYNHQEAIENGNVVSPWEASRLINKWVDGAEILYYGLAGAKSSRPLKVRLNDLLKHAFGDITERGPHKGGEIIWQLKNWQDFELWALPTGAPPEPRDKEYLLLKKFYETTGKLPFANRQF